MYLHTYVPPSPQGPFSKKLKTFGQDQETRTSKQQVPANYHRYRMRLPVIQRLVHPCIKQMNVCIKQGQAADEVSSGSDLSGVTESSESNHSPPVTKVYFTSLCHQSSVTLPLYRKPLFHLQETYPKLKFLLPTHTPTQLKNLLVQFLILKCYPLQKI